MCDFGYMVSWSLYACMVVLTKDLRIAATPGILNEALQRENSSVSLSVQQRVNDVCVRFEESFADHSCQR